MDTIRSDADAAPHDADPLVRDILARHAGRPGALLPLFPTFRAADRPS